jgi:protein dithiol:quinone oxidoreductase
MLTHFQSNKTLLLACACACASLLAYALYLQHVQGLAPCPLCVMQRYAFIAVMVGCLAGAFSKHRVFGAAYGLFCALVGGGIAAYHLWVKAHPSVSCGIDPLETALNKIWPALWLPSVFNADGLCSAVHEPILGLSIPQWSLVWFIALAIACGWVLIKPEKNSRRS